MLRRLFALSVLLLVALAPAALAANVKIRVEGKTTTIFGPAQPTVTADNALQALDAASTAGEFYYGMTTSSFGDYVSQIGKYPASESTGWVFKVNGVSPPVGADKVTLKDGDVVLWYYATFGPAGGPPTLELQRLPANCYVVQSVTDAGQAHALGQRDARGRREALQDEERPRLHRQARRARARDRARRNPVERPAVIRRALAALAALVLLAGCGGAGEEEGTATLWVTRDRGAEAAARREGRRGADADARARLEGRARDALRRPLRPGDRRSRGQPRGSARLVLVRQRLRGRPERVVLPAARRRRRLARLSRLAAGGRGARRRRRLSGAVPARLRREDASRCRPLRGLADAARTSSRARSAPRRSSRSGRLPRTGANVLEVRAGPDRATAELLGQSAGDPVQARAQRRSRADAAGTRCDEPRARSRPARRRRHRRSAGRPHLVGRAADRRPARRLPARAGRTPPRLPLRRALEQPRRAHALAVPLVGAGRDGALGGADDAGARAARRDDDGARPRRAERAAARGARARLRRLRAPARPRPARRRRPASRAARRWRSRWRHGSCRRSSAMRPGSPSRCGGEACGWRGRAATRRCSRRSSPARSSARRAWPRRWRRAASAGPGPPARRGRRGARATGSRSPAAVLIVVVALWL